MKALFLTVSILAGSFAFANPSDSPVANCGDFQVIYTTFMGKDSMSIQYDDDGEFALKMVSRKPSTIVYRAHVGKASFIYVKEFSAKNGATVYSTYSMVNGLRSRIKICQSINN